MPLITTLDRYLFGQLLQIVLFGLLMFTIIWLAPETLFRLIQLLFDEKITLAGFFKMIALHLPEIFEQSIPMAVLFGSLFLFRRLSLSLEMVTFLNAGISPIRLALPIFMVGLLFSALHLGIQEWVTPKTAPVYEAMKQEVGLSSNNQRNFTFVEKNRRGHWDKFLLIGQIQDFLKTGRLSDFFILYYQTDPAGSVYISRILRAAHGHWDEGAKAWRLFNGIDYELNEQGVFRENRPFREQWVTMSKYPFQLLEYSMQSPRDMDHRSLRQYIRLLEEGGQLQDVGYYEVRLQQKVAFPLASIFFALLGAFLGVEKIRSRQQYALLFGALLLFLYSVSIPFTTNMGSLGMLPPVIVAWLPMTLAAGLALILLQIRHHLEFG